MFLAGSSRPPCSVSSVSPSLPQPWRKTRSLPECSKPLAGAAGEVGVTGVLGGPPTRKPGLLFYIMVDSGAATLDAVVANGGEIVQPIGVDAPEITARFRDPSGNVIGLYQQPA